MIKISVIIPVYNGANYINKALDSIVQQNYPHYEIIVINDGSTDNTLNAIEAYKDDHADIDIRIVNQENKGVPASRNVGIQLAKGEFVCFLDADDSYCEDSLKLRVECLEQLNVNFLIGHYFKLKSISDAPKPKRSIQLAYPEIILETKGLYQLCDSIKVREIVALRGFPMHPNTFTYRTDFLKKLGMFDEAQSVNEDTELIYRTIFQEEKFGFVDKELCHYNYYMQYLPGANNLRVDITRFYNTERSRFVKLVSLMNKSNTPKHAIRGVKKRMCCRKYRYKGLMEYRSGRNWKALQYYYKAKAFDPNDKETKVLIRKAYVPRFIQKIGKLVINYIRARKYRVKEERA